jgi:flagellin
MSYLLTNSSALTALQNLTMTQQSLSDVQSELSTGLSIQHASDNTSYWSIAQTMSSDNGALGAASSALKTSSSMLGTFTSALEQTISVVNNIKNDLVEAQNPGANLTQIQSDIAAQQNSLLQIASGTSFNGQNWLNGTVNGSTAGFLGSVNLVGAYTNNSGVSYIAVAASSASLYTNGSAATSVASASGGILGATSAGFSSSILGAQAITVTGATGSSVTTLVNMLSSVNNVISQLETAASAIGAAQEQVTTQQTFVSAMQTNLTNGVAALVDADMNQVSTRLQALQTQQQLGVQSLSIANQSSQLILKLFQ